MNQCWCRTVRWLTQVLPARRHYQKAGRTARFGEHFLTTDPWTNVVPERRARPLHGIQALLVITSSEKGLTPMLLWTAASRQLHTDTKPILGQPLDQPPPEVAEEEKQFRKQKEELHGQQTEQSGKTSGKQDEERLEEPPLDVAQEEKDFRRQKEELHEQQSKPSRQAKLKKELSAITPWTVRPPMVPFPHAVHNT